MHPKQVDWSPTLYTGVEVVLNTMSGGLLYINSKLVIDAMDRQELDHI
jgi:hypothetical protein